MTTGRDIILQRYRRGGKAIRMERNSYRRINVAPHINLDDEQAGFFGVKTRFFIAVRRQSPLRFIRIVKSM